MRPEYEFFTRNRTLLAYLGKQMEGVRTVGDFKGFALLLKNRLASELLISKIDRLTQRKVKADGTRDGRWAWQNSQAGMGRRINESRPVDEKFACALGSLVIRELAPEIPWKVIRNWRGRLEFTWIRKEGEHHRIAYDIMTLLLKQIKEGKM